MKKIFLAFIVLCLITSVNQAQESEENLKIEKKSNTVKINLKDKTDVTVFIDGKKYDNEILKIIDVNKIESIEVIKGKEAIDAYGVEKVLFMTTKKGEAKPHIKIIDKNKNAAKLKFRDLNLAGNDASKYPVIIIDGKTTDQNNLKELPPDSIYSIKVLKDEKSMKKYNTENGVIIVTTKKKRK